jgi:DHA1 family multidrug resistance protein-like MFS transporter
LRGERPQPSLLLTQIIPATSHKCNQNSLIDKKHSNAYNAPDNDMLKKTFPTLAASIFSAMLGVGLISPLLPLYAQDMGASGIELGLISAGYGICNALLTPVIGRLSDRKGRKVFLCIGLFLYSVISLGFIWASNPLQLILVRLIQGGSGAMILPVAMAYIGDLSPEGEEGKWMGYSNTAFFSGFGIGPLLGGALAERFGMNTAFYSMGGLCMLAFLVAVILIPESRPRKLEGESRPSFKEMSQSRIVRGLFSFRFVQAMGRGGLMTFLPIFAAAQAGLGTTLIGVLLAFNMLFMTALTAPVGRLADKFNRRTLVIIGNCLYLLSLALIPFARNFLYQMLLCLPRGLGSAISMSASSAMTVEEGRKFGMGSTMSILMMAMGLGMAVGPILGGVIADATDVNSVFYFVSATAVIGTGLFAWFTR